MIELSLMSSMIMIIAVIAYMIAIGVAIIAFWNYWKIRNWKLLVLAVAYTLLAAINILRPIINIFLTPYSRLDNYYAASNIISGLLVAAFAFLAYVYYTERRARGIKIDKLHWFIGCLVVTPLAVALLYFALVSDFAFGVSLGNMTIHFEVIPYLSGILIITLQTHTVISLHSYYQNIKNRNTLIVMTGFIFLLVAYVASFLSPVLLLIMSDHADIVAAVQSHSYIYVEQMVELPLILAGYMLFLVAMLRLKRS